MFQSFATGIVRSAVEVETVIARDMDAQQRWLHILRTAWFTS